MHSYATHAASRAPNERGVRFACAKSALRGLALTHYIWRCAPTRANRANA